MNGGWPRRTEEKVKKKWNNLVSSMKVKLDKMRRSGAGAVKWTDIDESVQDVLGKENPKLNAIPGGFSTPSTTTPETKVIVQESTSALAPSPMEDNAPRTADSSPRLTVSRKRKRAPADNRTHFIFVT